jgi:hypothetical protein
MAAAKSSGDRPTPDSTLGDWLRGWRAWTTGQRLAVALACLPVLAYVIRDLKGIVDLVAYTAAVLAGWLYVRAVRRSD